MNYRVIINVLGYLLLVEAGLMIPSLLVTLYYNSYEWKAFLLTIIITAVVGFVMSHAFKYKDDVQAREGIAIVGLGWVLVSIFGCLPYMFSGIIPNFLDAFFETVSGFTTTGSTIINNIESLPRGILFWRSFTQWVGGLGILVFTIALLPMLGIGGFQIYRKESPGPSPDRIVPRVRDTAKILYTIYIIITISQIILLRLGGISLYDSVLHSFGTAGTGGFAIKTNSVGYYNSSYIHIIIGIFMIMCGTNFSLYYSLAKGKWKDLIKNEELRLYLSIILVSILLISFNIYNLMGYESFGAAFKDSFFQVGSIISTTAYSTVNYNQWPTFSKIILFAIMFVGGCAGSTAGGMKNIRVLVLFRLIKREFYKIIHPRAILPVKVNGKAISNDEIAGVSSFFAIYILIFMISSLIISLEGIDFESSISVSAASINNIGPGFGIAGPFDSYGGFSSLSKLTMIICMLVGRLEVFTFVILFNPKIWKGSF